MAFQEQPGDIRATLAVSQEEARFGGSRVINLPGGRTATVVVPAGTRDGEELRLTGQGAANGAGGGSGDLILRVSVVKSESRGVDDNYATERALYVAPGEAAPAGYASGEKNPGLPAYVPPAYGPSFAGAQTDAVSGASPTQQSAGPGGYQSNPAYGQAAQPYVNYSGYQSNPAYGQVAPPQAQAYPAYGGYQGNPTYGQVAPTDYPQPVPPPRPKRSGAITALVIIIALVVVAGSVLVFYLGYYQPNQAHVMATQTAQSQVTATANVAASSTAQVVQAATHAAATSTAQVQATALAYQNIYTHATSGKPVLDDALTTPTLNSLWDITIGSAANGACSFTGGSYHSTIPTTGFFEPCYALNTNYSNFAFQVDMVITQGDFGGVLLRANSAHSKFYLFRIGVDGSFTLYNYTDIQGSQATLLLNGTSKAIKNQNQSNEITVVAQQTTMYFYLNRQYVGSTNDNSYTAGQIGVFAESAKAPTDVAFNNAKVWNL